MLTRWDMLPSFIHLSMRPKLRMPQPQPRTAVTGVGRYQSIPASLTPTVLFEGQGQSAEQNKASLSGDSIH